MKSLIAAIILAGGILPAFASSADLLALDDGRLVDAYIAALIRDSGNEPLARKVAYQDNNMLDPAKRAELAVKLRAAIRSGSLDQGAFSFPR